MRVECHSGVEVFTIVVNISFIIVIIFMAERNVECAAMLCLSWGSDRERDTQHGLTCS